MVSENVTFSSEGVILSGVLSHKPSHNEFGALVLHPHPLYGGDMSNSVVMAMEQVLLEVGFTTLRFDFRGASSTPQGYSGVAGAVIDASNAADVLLSRGIRVIGLTGYSFGGSTALRYATEHLPLFLITLSASQGLVTEGAFDMTQLSKVTCPTLMFHGQADRMVPCTDIETLSKQLGSKEIETVLIDREGHFYQVSLTQVMTKIKGFLRKIVV